MKKYVKIAKQISDDILIDDIEYACRIMRNAKIAIYTSISMGRVWIDESYLLEKMRSAKEADVYIREYISEAKNRNLSKEHHERFTLALMMARNAVE